MKRESSPELKEAQQEEYLKQYERNYREILETHQQLCALVKEHKDIVMKSVEMPIDLVSHKENEIRKKLQAEFPDSVLWMRDGHLSLAQITESYASLTYKPTLH